MDQVLERSGMIRCERKRALEIRHRPFDPAERQKHAAAAVEGIDIAPIGRERPIVARQRLLITRELGEHIAAIEVSFGKFACRAKARS